MIIPEPLKGKGLQLPIKEDRIVCCHLDIDILSACEWLKKAYRKQKGFFEMDDLIDDAFKDVII